MSEVSASTYTRAAVFVSPDLSMQASGGAVVKVFLYYNTREFQQLVPIASKSV